MTAAVSTSQSTTPDQGWQLGADRRYGRAVAVLNGRVELIPSCESLTINVGTLSAEVDRLQ